MKYAGRDITHQFRDVKEAVAYALSVRRGPQHRRPNYGAPRARGDRDAGSAVIACVKGNIGYDEDSPEWKAMAEWALSGGPTPPWIRTKLRPLLGQHGLLADQSDDTVRLELEDVTFIDEVTGEETVTVREVRDVEG